MKQAWIVLSLVLLWGCSVGPDYEKPEVTIPVAYKESKVGEWKEATPQDVPCHGKWWEIYHDSVLNDLEEKASCLNQNIAVAAAQYQEALAQVDISHSGFFPTVSGLLTDFSSKTPSFQRTTTTNPASAVNVDSLGLQAAWEIDVWGKVRRSVEAAAAGAEASQADLAAVKLSIQALLAQTYFQLRAVDNLQKVLDDNVAAYRKFLSLTKNQYHAGTQSQLAVMQAQAQLDTIEAQSINNGVARAQYEHAIAVLINEPPANFALAKVEADLTPPQVPIEVPSHLLERRPDIANAERLVAQANAEIGVAKAAYFPVLNFSGTRTIENTTFPKIFSAPVVAWAMTGQLAETFFDGGARAGQVDVSKAAWLASVATYRQTVLTAFQDVEDSLSSLRILNDQYAAQAKAVGSLTKQLQLTRNQYAVGTVSALDVLNAMFGVYTAQLTAVNISSQQMLASVGLIKALGGGYGQESKQKELGNDR